MQAFLERGLAEVDLQAHGQVEEGEETVSTCFSETVDRCTQFQFDDHRRLDQQINTKTLLKVHAVKFKRNGHLSIYAKSPACQFTC